MIERVRAKRALTAAQRADITRWRHELVAALRDADARILVGTDAGNPFVVPGASLHEELELLIAAGLSRPRAAALEAKLAELRPRQVPR